MDFGNLPHGCRFINYYFEDTKIVPDDWPVDIVPEAILAPQQLHRTEGGSFLVTHQMQRSFSLMEIVSRILREVWESLNGRPTRSLCDLVCTQERIVYGRRFDPLSLKHAGSALAVHQWYTGDSKIGLTENYFPTLKISFNGTEMFRELHVIERQDLEFLQNVLGKERFTEEAWTALLKFRENHPV